MKINNSKEVNSLRFTHKGNYVNFQCEKHVMPHFFGEFEKREEACIEFSDMHEVDYLIEMLERFKDMCEGNIGKWSVQTLGERGVSNEIN